MHNFQEQCQDHGQRSKNMACRKLTVFGAIMRLTLFSLKQCIIKQLLASVFVTPEIMKVSVSVISLSFRFRLITLTSTSTIPAITKTSSNNCQFKIVPTMFELCSCSFRVSFSLKGVRDYIARWGVFSIQLILPDCSGWRMVLNLSSVPHW